MTELVRDDMTLKEGDMVLLYMTTDDWVIAETTMNNLVGIQSYKVKYPTNSFWYNDLIDRDSEKILQVKKTTDAYKELALTKLYYK